MKPTRPFATRSDNSPDSDCGPRIGRKRWRFGGSQCGLVDSLGVPLNSCTGTTEPRPIVAQYSGSAVPRSDGNQRESYLRPVNQESRVILEY